MTGSPRDRRRPQWAVGENARAWIAAAAASVLSTGLIFVGLFTFPGVRGNIWSIGIILTWALFCAIHAALTAWVFVGTDRHQLEDLLRRGRTERRARDHSDDAPGWSMQLSLMSIIVVVLLIAIPALRAQPVILILGLIMIAAVWVSTALMYAVHYARRDLRSLADGGEQFGFAGDADRGFSDYLYIATIVQATFGPPDVSVRTSAARRTLGHHSVIAFVFNTGIVAVLISLLLATT